MTPELNDYLPVAAGLAVGAGAGVYLQTRVENFRQKNEERLDASWSVLEGLKRSKVGRILGVVTVASIMAGGLNGVNWIPEDSIQTTPAEVSIVVDQSGATALGEGLAAKEITTIVNQFNDGDNVEATAFVAARGEVRQVELKKVNALAPFGSAPLDSAARNALDKAALNQQKAADKNTPESNGVLVLTNGNSVEPAADIITEAKANSVPVFIVNVEDTQSNPQTVQELQQIAAQTDGKYWEANKKNIEQVGKVVKDTLAPQSKEDNSHSNKLPSRIFGALLGVAGVTLIYRDQKKRTLKNLNGISK